MRRVEEQLATQTRLLLGKGLSTQDSGAPSEENDHGVIQTAQETIRRSIQALISFFRTAVNALLLKLWIALPVVQHMLRTLQAFPLLASVPIADSIQFEDALGRISHLPYVHFRHHAVFMARLRCEFKNLPGEKKILLKLQDGPYQVTECQYRYESYSDDRSTSETCLAFPEDLTLATFLLQKPYS
jgi:hypothetical protein